VNFKRSYNSIIGLAQLRSAKAQITILVVAVLLVVAITGGCDLQSSSGRRANSIATSPIIQTVDVIEVTPTEDAYQATKFLGSLKPRRSIPLAFTQGGRVANINVVSGEEVAAEQVLANTDTTVLESQKAAAQTALDNANQQFSTNQGSTDLRNQISDLQRQLDQVDREIERATLKAPFAGTVVRRDIEQGQVVSAGMAVLDLVDSSSLTIEAKVATNIANGMVRGAPVWVLIQGQPFSATIATVLPAVKGATRTRMVTLEFGDDQSTEGLNAGDTVELRYWTQTGQSGFWLPYSALQQQTTGLWSAMVVEGKSDDLSASVRTLEVVLLQDQLALVQGALNDGDRVIVNGLNRIVPGQKVSAQLIENTNETPGPEEAEVTEGEFDLDDGDGVSEVSSDLSENLP